jgi:hypothetical protein
MNIEIKIDGKTTVESIIDATSAQISAYCSCQRIFINEVRYRILEKNLEHETQTLIIYAFIEH